MHARIPAGISRARVTLIALASLASLASTALVAPVRATVASGAAALLQPTEAGALPASVRAALPPLAPTGSGRLTWFGLHVYDARLFAATAPGAERVPACWPGCWSDTPLALEITYARRIAGTRIVDATLEELARLGAGSAEDRARWRADLQRLVPDVEAGHRLIGVLQPGQGLRLFADDRLLGSVDDPALARGFFGIWLDPRSRAPQLRASLLGSTGVAGSGAPATATR